MRMNAEEAADAHGFLLWIRVDPLQFPRSSAFYLFNQSERVVCLALLRAATRP
jgi:hypothetical protein